MKPKQQRNTSWLTLLILVTLAFFVWLAFFKGPAATKPVEAPIGQIIEMSQKGELTSVTFNGTILQAVGTDGTTYQANIGTATITDIKNLGLDTSNLTVNIQAGGIDWVSILLIVVPTLGIIILIFFVFNRARGVNNQALSFGRSRARLFPANKPTVTFDDVAGVDEAKQELREVVDFLKSRERFTTLGARIPRGILLVGPPGTGKTLLARAIAGEAGVPFFSISGSEFVEMFVGVGASRVRDLFDNAKRHAPCIIFIDEIDAVGRHRGAGLGGSHDEREQTLNQILTEMDGFDTNVNVIVLAATNRPDILDPALLRPGRFDRRVVLDLPDINGRIAILKVHTKNKTMNPNINLENLAKQTAGFSGADLANLVNEAAILAARRGKKSIDMEELEEATDKVSFGPERRSKRITPKEKEITAYHESGHAVVARMLPNTDPPNKVSIIPRGVGMGGFTKMLQEDRSYYSYSRLIEMIAVSLAGMATEKMIYSEASSGAQSDLRNATLLAEKMVTDLGMSKNLGPRTFGDKQENVFLGMEMTKAKDYSERTALAIDREVDNIISDANEMAAKILSDNKVTLADLTKTLITKETMDYDDLEAFFKSSVPADKLPYKNPWSELKAGATTEAVPAASPEKPEEKKT